VAVEKATGSSLTWLTGMALLVGVPPHLCVDACGCRVRRSAEDDVNSIGKPTVAVITIIVALEDKALPKV